MRQAVKHAWQAALTGGTTLPVGGLDHFGMNGDTWPLYNATQPSSFYDATANTTWFANEGYDFVNLTRKLYVNTYNHTTRVWRGPYAALTIALVDDDHGVPSMAMSPAGHVFIFGGVHGTAILNCSTDRARDPTAWTAQPNLSSGTYPHPFFVGSDLYVFYRGGGLENRLFMQKCTPSGGTISSWAAQVAIGDMEGTARWYQGDGAVDGTDIHMTATKAATSADLVRQNVYYIIFDTVTQGIKNYTGGSVIASGSLPASLATLQASYRIVDTETGGTSGTMPSLVRQAGNSYIAYMDGPAAGTSYKLYHTCNISNGGWITAEEIGAFGTNHADHRYDGLCIAPTATVGVMDFYWIAGSGSFTRGGKVVVRRRAVDTTLGTQTDVMVPARAYAFDQVAAVLNGVADARVMFAEISGDAANERQLRVYAYGDSGLLPRALPADVRGINLDFQLGNYRDTAITYERDATAVAYADNLDGSWTTFTGINAGPRRTPTKGLLVEPAATNLIRNGQFLGGTGWTANGVTVTANQDNSADGTATIDLINKTSATTFKRVSNSITGTVNVTYAFSVSLKAGTLSKATLRTVLGASLCNKMIDLTTGVITNSSSAETTGFVSASAVQLSNSLWRMTLVCTAPASGTTHDFWICPGDAGLTTTGTILAGDAMVEVATVASSFVPTLTAAVTRYADEVSFGIPIGINKLTYSFYDGTIQVVDVTSANRGAYTIPTNLTSRIIKTVVGS